MKIFFTVGSMYPLDRLTKIMDSLAKTKKYEVFGQIGESQVVPQHFHYTKFLEYSDLQEKIMWADCIVTHAGAGSIVDAMSARKKLILFPRLEKFGEAVDDHQLEICVKLREKMGVLFASNEPDLIAAINSKRKFGITRKENKLAKEISAIIAGKSL